MTKFLWPMYSEPKTLIVDPDEMLGTEFSIKDTNYFSDSQDDAGRVMPDFATFQIFSFFVSQRATKLLGDFITSSGRLLKTKWDGHTYHVAVIHRELDLFDYERSTYTRWGLYDDIKREVWEIQRVVIRTPPPDCPDIFRLKGNKSVHFNIIVSDRFKRLYEENAFTGLYFRRADLPLN